MEINLIWLYRLGKGKPFLCSLDKLCSSKQTLQLDSYLLVDDNKSLVGAITHFFLEGDDFPHSFIDEVALRLDEFLPLGSTLVEEARIYFTVTEMVGTY